MEKILISLSFVILLPLGTFAQNLDSAQIRINEIETSLNYQTGTIDLESGNAILRRVGKL